VQFTRNILVNRLLVPGRDALCQGTL